MKNFFCFLCCVLLTQAVVKAQMKIGDNPTTINSASLLELEAINKGLVFPRVALTGLSSSSPLPAELLTGTVVFNTAAGVGSGVGLYYWNGSAWVGIGSGGSTPAPAWYITGNAGTLSSDFIGTTDNRSFRVRTNDIQRMIIDSFGNVTIDSAVFITKGQMKIGDDPTAINSASLLELESVDKGIVFPRISIPDAASPAPLPAELLVGTVVYNTNASINKGKGPGLYIWSGGEWSPVSFKEKDAWSVNGNTAISPDSNFLGTTDSVGLHIRTSNKQRMLIDSIGSVAIGLPTFNPDPLNRELLVVDQGPSLSHTVASFKGNKNSYLQINVQNKSAGRNASSDFVATANDGTDSTFFVDLGINGSNFAPTEENWGNAHDAYMFSNSRNLLIGAQAQETDVMFLLGGGKIRENAYFRITGPSGNVVVGRGENTEVPEGNVIRGPRSSADTVRGGSLTLRGGPSTGNAQGGTLNLFGGNSRFGLLGDVNISGENISLAGTSLNVAGVRPTASLASDSVLTVFGGSLKKAPYSSVFPVLRNLITVTLPQLGNNSGVNLDVTVPNTPYIAGGPNPVVAVNPEVDLPDGLVIAWVRVFAQNSVRIHVRNVTNTTINSQQIEFDVSVIK